MADTSGNKAVIFSVIGVAAAVGVVIYLLSRKTNKVVDQLNQVAAVPVTPAPGNPVNTPGVGIGAALGGLFGGGSSATNPYIINGTINNQLGIKDTSSQVHTTREGAEPVRR